MNVFVNVDPGLIQLNSKEITRTLSSKKGQKKTLSDAMLVKLQDAVVEARELISPQSVYDFFEPTQLPNQVPFAQAELVALAVCTIGSELPELAKKLMQEGNLVKGILMDAIGSVAAEELAEHVNELIELNPARDSLTAGSRYSPGYCNWALASQEVFFNSLQTDEIAVTLTRTFLMQPVKTVSFAVNFAEKVDESRWEKRCETCEDQSCTYRRK